MRGGKVAESDGWLAGWMDGLDVQRVKTTATSASNERLTTIGLLLFCARRTASSLINQSSTHILKLKLASTANEPIDRALISNNSSLSLSAYTLLLLHLVSYLSAF